ncbi:class I SAM-dependent methyltransferase [Methylocella sp.]|uniref:class I SAM-dependent methyltransferase n=1 Tax=Methylocella sp. TaxID=1978226 RepID=UPI003C176CAF
MIDRALVEACYRGILGREPENEAVAQERLDHIDRLEDLIAELFASDEFVSRLPQSIGQNYSYGPAQIDVDVPRAKLDQLFERHRLQWRALGETEPFWSVLTHDEFKTANLTNVSVDAFYATGKLHADFVDLFAQRNRTPVARGTCLELGCGVGRVTKHLAERFDKILAIDISEGNLQQCRKMAAHFGIKNIEFILMQSPAEAADLPSIDFFYSAIVLQHNSPPVQKFILDCILSKLKPGGAFYFQTQTYTPGYRFDIDEYLASPPNQMDMHCLPMHEIFRLVENHCLSLRETLMDLWTGRYGSHTFFGILKSLPPPSRHIWPSWTRFLIHRRLATLARDGRRPQRKRPSA